MRMIMMKREWNIELDSKKPNQVSDRIRKKLGLKDGDVVQITAEKVIMEKELRI